ncbi:hypothetical protein CLF_101014 [Clonorchis sinensis]|uniref:Uncharacterized protein n=1 Tax=Clonorchis sinensis TaxID=79923 RepID=G7Y4S4_CLOSI|nr:hypothetical protein CLF_101014 [Clonorchis sinensis]
MLTVYSSRSKCPINSLPYIALQIVIHITSSAVATTCNSRLLSDRVQVPDTAFEHSSAFNLQHGASAAR